MSKIEVIEKTCELVLAKLQVLGRKDLYVGSFYRHTNSDPASIRALSENLLAIMGKERPKNFVLAGDFNLPSVNWETNDISPSPQYGREVNQMALDMCNDLFLTQMVEETTRGRNILDLIFVSSPDLVSSVETKAVIAEIALKAKVSKKKPRTIFMYDKADQDKVASEITSLKHEFLSKCADRDANSNWLAFTQGLRSVMIKCIPQRVIRARYDLPWLDHSLRKKIRKKNKYHRLAKKAKPHKRDQRWRSYRKIQSDVKTEIHQAHDRYINSLFEDDSGKPSKKLWKSIKAKKRDQVGVPPLKGRNGKLETTSKGKAQILNNQ